MAERTARSGARRHRQLHDDHRHPRCGGDPRLAPAEGRHTMTDQALLEALNDDYVRSVQTSDVRRFDEMLAPDFLCSLPDGSLLDRSQFLAFTAKPVTVSGL